MSLSPATIAASHLIDDAERARTKALRAATQIDRLMADLHHAISHGRRNAALDMLASIDRYNLTVLDAVTLPAPGTLSLAKPAHPNLFTNV